MDQNVDHHTHPQSHAEHDQNNPSLISQASTVIQQVYSSSFFIMINEWYWHSLLVYTPLTYLLLLLECRQVAKWRIWHKEQPTLWKTLLGWVRPPTTLAARPAGPTRAILAVQPERPARATLAQGIYKRNNSRNVGLTSQYKHKLMLCFNFFFIALFVQLSDFVVFLLWINCIIISSISF